MNSKKRKRDKHNKICLPNEIKVDKVEEALDILKKTFNKTIFGDKFPAILWKHQCYALVKNRTLVDKILDKLCNEGTTRLLKLGTTVNDYETALVFLQDYVDYIYYIKKNEDTFVVENFIKNVLKVKSSMSYSTSQLEKDGFNQTHLTQLVRIGILVVHRKAGYWLLSIPNCGQFYKKFLAGRKALISTVKKTKYQEISKNELEIRSISKKIELGLEYHIFDLIGSDSIECVESPTGTFLRIPS